MNGLDSFAEWLRQWRTALGLTRVELAKCAGCSVSALRKIEADERRTSRQLAELLAGCLRIAPEAQLAFVDAARGAWQAADDRLVDRASELGRVLFSQDDDLLAEAKRRQVEGVQFAGVLYAHQIMSVIMFVAGLK